MGIKTGEQKIYLVAWDGVCLPVGLEGLGLKRLGEFIVALLYEWFWCMSEDKLWVRI